MKKLILENGTYHFVPFRFNLTDENVGVVILINHGKPVHLFFGVMDLTLLHDLKEKSSQKIEKRENKFFLDRKEFTLKYSFFCEEFQARIILLNALLLSIDDIQSVIEFLKADGGRSFLHYNAHIANAFSGGRQAS